MAVMPANQPTTAAPKASFFYRPEVRQVIYQLLVVGLIVFAFYEIISNTLENLRRQNIASGFGFLDNTSGFDVSQSLIAYSNTSTYGRAFLVGLLNTLLVAGIGIVLATIFGFLLGIARLSTNWLVAKIAEVYVEIVRNVPLLLQLFFWYFAVLKNLPHPRQSMALPAGASLNVRGLYLPAPVWVPGLGIVLTALAIAIIASLIVWRWSVRRQQLTGERFPVLLTSLGLIVGLPLLASVVTGFPFAFEYPALRGFNFQGGMVVQPEFMALLLGLTAYTAAFIGEIVRSGIIGVHKGQKEASKALGLSNGQTLRLVVIPQAMRIIIPPLTSQYLNLTKNSSLAVAIGYPDLVSVFAGTVLNQTGQAVEVILITMGVYLTISLLTSAFMNWFNRRVALVERGGEAKMAMETTPSTGSAPMRPPRQTSGPVAWLRDNLFSSVGNTILTVIGLWIVYKVLSGFINWAFINAVWEGNDGAACSVEGAGACWPFIKAKYQQFLYGRYPEAERWRVDLTYAMAVIGLVALMVPRIPAKGISAVFTLFIFPIIAYWLLTGSSPSTGFDIWDGLGFLFLVAAGVLLLAPSVLGNHIPAQLGRLIGIVSAVMAAPMLARWLFSTSGLVNLPIVETELWGGLLITLVVASVGIVASFPIGIVLALGRRSKMPIVRWVSVAFIEFIRGVPLITMLFMASVMLPLFLPPNVTFDKLLRALVGVAIFSGAYMAEVIRGGLQAIPRGQFEAGEALGLSYWQRMGLIVLPQALKLVIPGIVNSFIGLFKDTSLVLIIGLFDLLGIVQLNQSDSKWFSPTTAMTGYFFAGAVFWIFCFGMSRYSLYMERRLDTGHKS